MFSLINFKSLLKRRESVVMKPNIDLGDVIPCRTTIATGITCVVGVIGSAVLLIQGVKYFSQISNRRERKEENRQRNKQSNVCSQCGIKVNLEDITTFAVCRSCDETICRSRHCSDWDRQTGYWECLVCIKSRDSQVRAGEWILDQLNRRFKVPRSEQSREDVVSYKDAETQSERSFNGSTYSISLEQKERVRQFLEEVIAEVVGGSLDEIPVTQLNRHPEYLPVWDHECPGVTHLNLKRLIQKVMAEAMRLPDLFNQSGIPPRPEEHMPFFDPKKYEQLVATAVLNKIIESFRNPKNSYADLSSGIHTGSEAENVNEKRVSSMSDQGEPKEDPQYLKEYIQKHKVPLPDLSTAGDSEGTLDDISDCQSVRSSGTEGTWEENWLFKKRKLKAEATASIAMLVPSPTEEVKALIGDKNADEISDLSEAEDVDNDSDNDEDVKELPSVLVQSKTVIGGKNELNSFDDDSSIGDNSLVSNPDSGINVTETKNDALMADEDFVKVDKPIEEAVNVNVKVVEAIVAEAKIVQEEKPVAAPRKASREEPAAEDVKKPAGDTVPEPLLGKHDDDESSMESNELMPDSASIETETSATVTIAEEDKTNTENDEVLIESHSKVVEEEIQVESIEDEVQNNHLYFMKPTSLPSQEKVEEAQLMDVYVFNGQKWLINSEDNSGLPAKTNHPYADIPMVPEEVEVLNNDSIIEFLAELKPKSVPLDGDESSNQTILIDFTAETSETKQSENDDSEVEVSTKPTVEDNTKSAVIEEPAPLIDLKPLQLENGKTPESESSTTPLEANWVFVESGWTNVSSSEVAPEKTTEEQSLDVFQVVNTGPEFEPIPEEYSLECYLETTPQESIIDQVEKLLFLDELKPHTLPSIDDSMVPANEFLSKDIENMKPVSLPVDEQVCNSKLDSGWQFSENEWKKMDSVKESILDSSGRICPWNIAEKEGSEEIIANGKDFSFNRDFLLELKPATIPGFEDNFVDGPVTKVLDLPTPEMELSKTNEFVCVMTYDADNGQIVCGMPASKKAIEEQFQMTNVDKGDEIEKEPVINESEEASESKPKIIPQTPPPHITLPGPNDIYFNGQIIRDGVVIRENCWEEGVNTNPKTPDEVFDDNNVIKDENSGIENQNDITPTNNDVKAPSEQNIESKPIALERVEVEECWEEGVSDVVTKPLEILTTDENDKGVAGLQSKVETEKSTENQKNIDEPLKVDQNLESEITTEINKNSNEELKNPIQETVETSEIDKDKEQSNSPKVIIRELSRIEEVQVISEVALIEETVQEIPFAKLETIASKSESDPIVAPTSNIENPKSLQTETKDSKFEKSDTSESNNSEGNIPNEATEVSKEKEQINRPQVIVREVSLIEEVPNTSEVALIEETVEEKAVAEIKTVAEKSENVPLVASTPNTENPELLETDTKSGNTEVTVLQSETSESIKPEEATDLSNEKEQTIRPMIIIRELSRIEEVSTTSEIAIIEENILEKTFAELNSNVIESSGKSEEEPIIDTKSNIENPESVDDTNSKSGDPVLYSESTESTNVDANTSEDKASETSVLKVILDREKKSNEALETDKEIKIIPTDDQHRYKSEMFQNLLPTSPPPATVKVSDIVLVDASKVAEDVTNQPGTNYETNNTNNAPNNQITVIPPPSAENNSSDTVLEENIPEEKPEGGNVDENNNSPDEHLIPGSLAEREHLKWLKATAEIPNNPYSAEALQKRIKGSTDPTAFTIPTTTNVEQTHDDEINREEALQKEDEKEKTNDGSSAQERSIQVVLGSGEPDYKRYGRDYYINDSKRARGTRKKAESDEVNRQVSSEDSPNMESAEIFIAKPIMVEVEDDDDGQDTVDEPNNINTPSPASTNLLESLPTSEDSDTTRIYDIKTGETRYEIRAKPISPETMKFFAPKKVPDFSPTTEKNKSPSPPEALSPRPIKTEQSTNDIINKLVIEEDVLPVLPSVKKLANVFANTTSPKTETLAPVQRPKNLILNDSPTTPEEEKVATKVSSIMKNQGNQPFKPGYSITGRSLSKQFREELKQSTNSPEEHSNEQQENEDKRTADPETVESTVENSNSDEGRQSPERPISPVLIPGRLKNNIAFFENLKRH